MTTALDLDGGPGNDILNGGTGFDVYVQRAGGGYDRVYDSDGLDRMDIIVDTTFYGVNNSYSVAPVFANWMNSSELNKAYRGARTVVAARQLANWLVVLVAAVFGTAVASLVANAQRPTSADVDEMFPPSTNSRSYRMPYYKWSSGAAIDVVVVTGKQRGVCVDTAVAKIRREVRLIRDLVPELRNMHDPEVSDWIPESKLNTALLIGLEMKDASVEQAMKEYVRRVDPRAQFIDSNRSTNMDRYGDGFGIQGGHIVQAYRWAISGGGLEQYSEATCQRSDWDSGALVNLLGGGNFTVIGARHWLRDVSEQDRRLWQRFLARLFLKSLYACPGAPAATECLRGKVKALAADTSLSPKE